MGSRMWLAHSISRLRRYALPALVMPSCGSRCTGLAALVADQVAPDVSTSSESRLIAERQDER